MASNDTNFMELQNFLRHSSLADSNGILRSNRFEVDLNPPPIFKGLKNTQWLRWQVLSVICPDITVETDYTEVNSWVHYYLKSRTDQDLDITFLESSNLLVRSFFYYWINQGFNNETCRRKYISDVESKVMKVVPLDHKGNRTKGDVFYSVFPVSINSMDYDMTAEDGFLKTTVKFKFRFHTVENV